MYPLVKLVGSDFGVLSEIPFSPCEDKSLDGGVWFNLEGGGIGRFRRVHTADDLAGLKPFGVF